MKNTDQEKDKIRKDIASLKKQYSLEDLQNRSEEVMSVLEITGIFQDAKKIFIYNNLSDEVHTSDFIGKWADTKEFYLPVTHNENITFRKVNKETSYKTSSLGILEPEGVDFTAYNEIDLIIIPGVAFDRSLNRLGRGKGYYDRFLSKLSVPKVGICFDFQLLDKIPVGENDIKMDYLVSENELIWK